MTSRERMHAAMSGDGAPPDRVPVMCQLALGHYFLHATGGPVDIWHDSEAFARALVELQRRYGFDGILVNLPGRPPDWRSRLGAVERRGDAQHLHWADGRLTIAPDADNPHVVDPATGRPVTLTLSEVDPDDLFYVEPHDICGVTRLASFPSWHYDTLRQVRELAPDVSVHGEVFSPFTQLMELVGPMEGALGLALDAEKVRACLDRLAAGSAELAVGLCDAGADAILVSSAYAGSGFISPGHYSRFVLPAERAVIAAVKEARPGVAVYTHTCGAIGDRLELMEATGTDGIDTLDPPPLGNVDLQDAINRLGGRLFIKGNVDPVNTVLRGTPEACFRDASDRIRIAGGTGRYILSTACSVPPHAPPANILALARAANEAS